MFTDLMHGLYAIRNAFLKHNLTLPSEITFTFDDIDEAAKAKMELQRTISNEYRTSGYDNLKLMGIKINLRFKDKVQVINERPI